MKNKQRGFLVPLLITIISLLVVSGGAYVYLNQHPTIAVTDQTDANVDTVNNVATHTQSSDVINKQIEVSKTKKPVLKVSGPHELTLDQSGTWTVNTKEGDDITYSVNWGDNDNEGDKTVMPKFGGEYPPFTHTYSDFGAYNIVFAARNSDGEQTIATTSVRVMNTTSPGLNTRSEVFHNSN